MKGTAWFLPYVRFLGTKTPGKRAVRPMNTMAQKFAKGSALALSAASRCSVTAIIWSLAAWILLIHVYTSLYPPNSPLLDSQPSLRRLPMYRELEELDEKVVQPKEPRRKPGLFSPRRHRPRKISAADDFLNASSLRRQFYFPDKNLAINPLKCPATDLHYFYPGREWRDSDGRPIQAHGGGILYVSDSETFYWYGENKDARTYRAYKRASARVTDSSPFSENASTLLWVVDPKIFTSEHIPPHLSMKF